MPRDTTIVASAIGSPISVMARPSAVAQPVTTTVNVMIPAGRARRR
jgi:hypothetical protein